MEYDIPPCFTDQKYFCVFHFYTSRYFSKKLLAARERVEKNVADFDDTFKRYEIVCTHSSVCVFVLMLREKQHRKRLTFHLKHFKATFPFTAHSSRVSHPLLQTLFLLCILSNICALKGTDEIPK